MGRPNDCHGGPGTADPGTFACTNAALSQLVSLAYGLQFYELVAPEWMMHGGESGYDVVAKLPAGTNKEQYQLMLRNLLADRFHLIVHRENKTVPRYVLRPGKHPKLTSSSGMPPPGPPSAMTIVDGHIRFVMRNQPLATFVDFLTIPLAGPVTDETGLQGKYDLTLDFMPDERWRGFSSLARANTGDSDVPGLSEAIEDQLALKLETLQRSTVVVVVDRADKVPAEN